VEVSIVNAANYCELSPWWAYHSNWAVAQSQNNQKCCQL